VFCAFLIIIADFCCLLLIDFRVQWQPGEKERAKDCVCVANVGRTRCGAIIKSSNRLFLGIFYRTFHTQAALSLLFPRIQPHTRELGADLLSEICFKFH
jgi:hypothetical protein